METCALSGLIANVLSCSVEGPFACTPESRLTRQFTLTRAEVVAADPTALRAMIVSATGSEAGAESVLRSLERLGTDPSIERYEMTHVSGRGVPGGAPSSSWRIRAERAGVPDLDAEGR